MNKIEFTKALSAMTDSLTKTDVEDAWDTYQDLVEQLSESEGNEEALIVDIIDIKEYTCPP